MAWVKTTEQHGQPIALETLHSVVTQFIAAFERADKRERTTMLLLTRPRDPDRRIPTVSHNNEDLFSLADTAQKFGVTR